MPRRDPVSIFFGPHRAVADLANWPVTVRIHLQLHGLRPGSLATPPLPAVLTTPKVLIPIGFPGLWQAVLFPFAFNFVYTQTEHSLTVLRLIGSQPIFDLLSPFAIDTWAYNLLTDPAGVFAFGGSVTLSWKEP